MRGAQAVFDHDNGTGRFVHVSAQGQPASDEFMRRWLSQVPTNRRPHPRGDVCHAQSRYRRVLVLVRWRTGLQLLIRQWEDESYTWHTDLDTFDKVVIDDVRSNAIVLAMLAYLASEDPTRLPRDAPPNPSIPCLAPVRRSH